METPEVKLPVWKTLPKYDTLWTYLGLFIPVPMKSARLNPDFVIGRWGFSSTIAIGKFKIPLGLIMVIIALVL